ncbi:hypothetical protein CDIK_2013 [Cucumispora dikerogammari]|nr:hypothetical protein CDIK_2013 [Cucumispora dikerogammari]
MGIDTATEADKSTPFLISALADIRKGEALSAEGETILFIGWFPTDDLSSVAATEPSLLLPALAGNNKDGEGESFLFIGMIPTDNLLSVAATEADKSTLSNISALADILDRGALSAEGGGRVGGKSIPANLFTYLDNRISLPYYY